MTQDEIIQMAKQAGFYQAGHTSYQVITATIQDFAKLVAEHEREACAKVCEAQEDDGGEWDIQQQCANAIRARGQA